MITTPEQMRATAAQIVEQYGRSLADEIRAIHIAPHPADPLSDPRVVALVGALITTREKLLSHVHDQYDGVWSDADFADETREADAALRAIGGEA